MISCFQHLPCRLGEGPLWVKDRLYWFDILDKRLYHCASDDSDTQVVQFQEHFSAAALTNTADLLLASETALWRFNPSTQALTPLIALEADNPVTRSNDGRADRQGGFWIGTMGKKAEAKAGSIYRYYQGELRCLRRDLTITNAICFAPDGRTAYFADTDLGQIYQWRLDAQGWPEGEPSIFVDLSSQGISPDGAVIDSQGYLWSAQWGSSRLVSYQPNGIEDKVIHLPVSQPSCPAFGGTDLSRLFVTSARDGLSAEALRQEPLAGSVLEVKLPLPLKGYPEGVVQL
ncbi:MAG: SMP-30/gluconolactonase/LRE family protein [Thiothrix sp.]|nr:MAG: SMP-30/gluconolactonase/LRE family protein [Thiothrix sp.]